jgi:Pyridine nucleotide-disulphide oxidoreductase, dimerisation domain
MFTDPPLAHVGLSEREAEHQGVGTRVARLPTSEVLRAQATGEKQGLMKAIVSRSDNPKANFVLMKSRRAINRSRGHLSSTEAAAFGGWASH